VSGNREALQIGSDVINEESNEDEESAVTE
jgi:hypothetical protein